MSHSFLPCSDTLLQKNPDLVAAELDGELVMMNAESGQYYSISGVGYRAFELLESPVSIDELVNVIASEYDTDKTSCRHDLQDFIAALIENGLVKKSR